MRTIDELIAALGAVEDGNISDKGASESAASVSFDGKGIGARLREA
jgi:hypothetical protein